MLDKYKENQFVIYNILQKSINQNKYSHAYLFELNDYEDSKQFIMDFTKSIIFKNIQPDENQLKNIEKNIHPDLYIVEPEGNIINKKQIKILQKELSEVSITNNNRVYIISNAEKMNAAAYNSILKFLEEPKKNIIGILSTSNIYQLNQTVISRCQVLNFKKKKNDKNYIKKYLDENINIQDIYEFILILEKEKNKGLLYAKSLWLNKFKGKDIIYKVLNIIILIYKDSLNYKLNNKTLYVEERHEILMISKQKEEKICKKISVLLKYITYVNYNLNDNLFIDRMIIEIGRCE